MLPKGMKMNTGSFTWIILSSLIVCGVSEFTCPKFAELGSSALLTCTYSNASLVTYTLFGVSGTIAICESTKCRNRKEGYYSSFISSSSSKLEIRKVQLKDGEEWTCEADSDEEQCTLVLTQTPTCHITSGNDTNNLDIHENISLSVKVTDYYCSTPIDFLLQAGNTEEDLLRNHTVKEKTITSGVFNSTFNVTESHLGSMELIFICNNTRKAVQCGGVHTLRKRPPMCNITADGDAREWGVGDEITMSVYIEDYSCSGDLEYFLLTGGETDRRNVTGIYNETITFTLEESHFGPVYLYMNCNNGSRNLTCDGIQELSERQNTTTSTPLHNSGSVCSSDNVVAIVLGTIAGAVFIVATVILIWHFKTKRDKSSTSSTHEAHGKTNGNVGC